MVTFNRVTHASDTSVAALIIFHLFAWFKTMGGVPGITESTTYPFSLFVVPVTIWVTALVVFHILIYPLAVLARYTCNEINISSLSGFAIFLVIAAVAVALPAHAYGGSNPMTAWLTWVAYLGIGFGTFWYYGSRRH